ncbi:MAG: Stk1 family PASTA domain-containing Ser/Thr kinase [Lachnospiraceae bacterium]|jgi:serine/threonine protein kinase|nr:Stk1 family PASTA domain-containing Ser/Thr kinase [Lachnospiraceae bacterium]
MLEPGRVLVNRYEIVEEIGSGGMAIVYKAKDYKLRRMVALKVLKHEYAEDEAVLSKFRKEALAAGSLTHPNIVAVYDLGQEFYIDFIVMEYIDGITLKEYIKRRDMLSSEEVLKISIKIAEALKVAHTNGIIHRDIKPQNIMVTPQGDVKVTDFGIAKAATSATITNQGEALGSVHYFSPEQARGSFVDARSDLYSLGISMYEMVTKQLPFTAETPVAVAMCHLHDALPDPQRLAPQIWPGVRDIIIKLTQKRPDLRYQTADELIQDMKRVYKNPGYRIREVATSRSGDYINRNRPPMKSPEEQERERQMLIAQREQRRRQQRRRKNLVITGAVLSILLLVLLIVLLKQALTKSPAGESSAGLESSLIQESSQLESSASESGGEVVKMPKVEGMAYEAAREELNRRGIHFQTEGRNDETVEVGNIISQEPAEDTEIKDNISVILYVSVGKEQSFVPVPDVTNLPQEEAIAKLKEQGLDVGQVSSEFNDTYPEGYVINQGTEKNTEVLKNTPIDITVSKGPQESSASTNGGTISITQLFAKEGDGGRLVVQAYDADNQATKIYDNQISYSTFELFPGKALKVNYPAGTERVEVYLNDGLIMSEKVKK